MTTKFDMGCKDCGGTGILASLVSTPKEATPLLDVAGRQDYMKVSGVMGPPLRIELCQCVVERLNRFP